MKKQRAINIELLRVLSMLMVVAIHLFTKTGVLQELSVNSPVYYMSWILYALCMTGVNCFVLISGYFLVDASFKFEKLITLYLQVLFYSVVMAVVTRYLLHLEPVSGFSKVLLPVTSREYWFISVYIGLYVLSPFVNIFVRSLDERMFKGLLIVLGILFSVIPTFLHAENWLEEGGAYGIAWFVFLYLTGAYIKKYYKINSGAKTGWLYLLMIMLLPLSKFGIMLAGAVTGLIGWDKVLKISEVFYCFHATPVLFASVLIFVWFLRKNNIPAWLGRIVTVLSPLTFGVYLIHNNRNFSHYLFEDVLGIDYRLVERGNIVVVIGMLLLVFFGCAAIEWVRQQLFKVMKADVLALKAAKVCRRVCERIVPAGEEK